MTFWCFLKKFIRCQGKDNSIQNGQLVLGWEAPYRLMELPVLAYKAMIFLVENQHK